MRRITKYYKSLFIIIVFSITILFISFLGSLLNASNEIIKEREGIYGRDFKKIDIYTENKNINNKDLLKAVNECSDIIFQNTDLHIYFDEGTLFGSAIYFNKNINTKLPVMEGRYFSISDCKSAEPLAVVGKGILNRLEKENNNSYLVFNNIRYKVIGVIGYENKSSYYDSRFILNLSHLLKNDIPLDKDKFIITSSQGFAESIIKELSNEFSKDYKGVNIELSELERPVSPIRELIENSYYFIGIIAIVIIACALNLINITAYWITDKRKELGIRKAVGGTDFNITLKIIKDYQKLTIISAVIAIIMHYSMINFLKTNISQNLYISFFNIIVVLISAYLLGLIVSLIPIIKSKRISPSEIMKGR